MGSTKAALWSTSLSAVTGGAGIMVTDVPTPAVAGEGGSNGVRLRSWAFWAYWWIFRVRGVPGMATVPSRPSVPLRMP